MKALIQSQGITKEITCHPDGNINVRTKFNDTTSHSCEDISQVNKVRTS